MRLYGLVLIASGLLAQAAGAEDGAAARGLIDGAIRAHGGEAALAKWPVVTVKTEGIFHGFERTPVFFFTSEMTNHGADQWRHVLDGALRGQKFRVTNVLDGGRGWVELGGNGKEDAREFTPAELRDRREAAYVAWVSTLLPLRGREFTLTLAGEETVGDRPAVGVRVSSEAHRDVTLFFDKGTRLLVKTETRSMAGTGVEGKVETYLRLHKDVRGVKRPMMMMTWHDGRSLISHWVREYRLAEAPVEGTFAKP